MSAVRCAVRRCRARKQDAARALFFEGFGERNDLFQSDRIHPTAAAQSLLLDNVWPVLLPFWTPAMIDPPCDATTTRSPWPASAISASASTCAALGVCRDHVPGARNHPVLDDGARTHRDDARGRLGLRGEAHRSHRRAQPRGNDRDVSRRSRATGLLWSTAGAAGSAAVRSCTC